MNPNLLSNRIRPECALRNGFYLGKVFLAVILILLHAGTFAQSTISVSGIVTDTRGESLPGVSVKLKGSTSGVATDLNGRYTLSVPGAGAVLVFTYIGFDIKEETVGNRSTLNVTLTENISSLDEVVIIGYGGEAKKRDLAGATSSISAKDIKERQPINLFDALQGQASGVLITNDGGGAPGAEGTIQIRGLSTLNGGNAPLYLVDGVINPSGSSINPSDIANIEILKDAASAAIYGARAANGVILITTKKGIEGKSRIDVQYSHIFGKLANKLPQSNGDEVRAFRRLQNNNPLAGVADSLNPSYNADTDQQDLLMGQTAHRNQLNIGLGGGAKGLTYYAGINLLDDRSIIVNSWLKRVQTRINIGYQATPKLRYSNNLTFQYQDGNTVPISRIVPIIFDRPAYSRIFYPDGTLTGYVFSKRNPYANALYEINKTETFEGQFNNQLEYQISKDFRFTTLFNAILKNGKGLEFSPRRVDDRQDQNSGANEMTRNFNWEAQAFVNYNRTFNMDHSLQGVLGVQADRRRDDRLTTEYKDVVNEEIFVTLPAYLNALDTETFAEAQATASLFTRLNYAYKSRYILAGVYRRDGSSKFGPDSRWGNFFSGSAAWRFSDEGFMGWSKNFLDDAKLRVSYGEVGNDRIDNYQSITKVGFSGSYNDIGGAGPNSTFGNSFIQWETTATSDVGLELAFLKGRLTFTTDYYIKTTSDLLYGRDLAKETGYTNVQVNVGSIQNRGLEFSLQGTPVVKNDFRWDVNANITFERGKVVQLANGIPFIAGNKWYIEEGGRIGNFFGWENLGVYQWNESNAYTPDWEKLTVELGADGRPRYENGKAVYSYNGQIYTGAVSEMKDPGGKYIGGDTEWLDINKDGVIDDADRHVIGNAQADFYMGLMNTISYKRLGLSFLFNGSFGGEIYNSLQYSSNYPSNTGSGNPMVVYNSWQKQGDIATMPFYPQRTNRGNLRQHGNSLYIENGSFIRLSSLRFTYSIAPALARKFATKGLSAYIYGSNLATWTNYTGYDPEFSTNDPLRPNDDGGRWPKRRELGLGLNVNF